MQMAMGKSLQVEIRETNSCYYTILLSRPVYMHLNYIEVWKRSLDLSFVCLFVCYGFYQRPSKLGPV